MKKAIGWQEIPEKTNVSKYKTKVSIKEVHNTQRICVLASQRL